MNWVFVFTEQIFFLVLRSFTLKLFFCQTFIISKFFMHPLPSMGSCLLWIYCPWSFCFSGQAFGLPWLAWSNDTLVFFANNTCTTLDIAKQECYINCSNPYGNTHGSDMDRMLSLPGIQFQLPAPGKTIQMRYTWCILCTVTGYQ